MENRTHQFSHVEQEKIRHLSKKQKPIIGFKHTLISFILLFLSVGAVIVGMILGEEMGHGILPIIIGCSIFGVFMINAIVIFCIANTTPTRLRNRFKALNFDTENEGVIVKRRLIKNEGSNRSRQGLYLYFVMIPRVDNFLFALQGHESNKSRFDIGDKVHIKYDSGNPTLCEIIKN